MSRLRFTAIEARDVAGRIMDEMQVSEHKLTECLFRILASNLLCSMATVTSEGHPHINTAYFSYTDTLEVYFLSHPDSLHCKNLSKNPSMAMTVFSSAQQWTDPGRGTQLFGRCSEAAGTVCDEAESSYARRFPAYANWKLNLKDEDLADRYRFYRFNVTAVKVLEEKDLGDAVFVCASLERE